MKTTLSAILLLSLSAVGAAFADTIAVVGTGNVASALGPEFASQGHKIVYGSRHPDSEATQALVAKTGQSSSATLPRLAVVDADIVVLAVPGLMVAEIVSGLGDLGGKIIIDPTNPLIGDWETELGLGVETSNAEIIQAAAPDSYVVKAFSTLGAWKMTDPDGPISILLAGNNDDAKSRVAEIVSRMDLDPIDLGPIRNAHWIEGMALMMLNNRISARPDFEFFLRKTP